MGHSQNMDNIKKYQFYDVPGAEKAMFPSVGDFQKKSEIT